MDYKSGKYMWGWGLRMAGWCCGLAALLFACKGIFGPTGQYQSYDNSPAKSAAPSTPALHQELFPPLFAVVKVRCASSSCHAKFATYDSEQLWIDNGYVYPGDPAKSPLFFRLRGADLGDPARENMPVGGTLAPGDVQFVAQVREWIEAFAGDETMIGAAPAPEEPDISGRTPFERFLSVMKSKCAKCHPMFNRYTDEQAWIINGYASPGSLEGSPIFFRLRGANLGNPAREDMPREGEFAPAHLGAVREWVLGAKIGVPPDGGDATTPDERTQWARKFLSTHCGACHNVGQTAISAAFQGSQIPPFTTFAADADFVTFGMVDPWNVDDSWLLRAIKDCRGSTAARCGGKQVPTDLFEILREWVRRMVTR